MEHPDHALWQDSWRANHIDFHLLQVHPLLPRSWEQLHLAASDRIFVPLCGKSLDLMWLRRRGHDIVGVELSPIAVKSLFKESRLQPRRTRQGRFTHWGHERFNIFCGDFFQLSARDMAGVKAVYDRASLTALPDDLRARYVHHLRTILPADCLILLLTVEDLEESESEAAAREQSAEIGALYGDAFHIDMVHAECAPAVVTRDGRVVEPHCVHKAYVLRPMALPVPVAASGALA